MKSKQLLAAILTAAMLTACDISIPTEPAYTQEQIDEIQAEKDSLQEALDSLQSEKDILQSEYENLQTEAEYLKEDIEALQFENGTLQIELDELAIDDEVNESSTATNSSSAASNPTASSSAAPSSAANSSASSNPASSASSVSSASPSSSAVAAITSTRKLGDLKAEDVFKGITVNVTNWSAQAVYIGIPIEQIKLTKEKQVCYFYDINNNRLGSISGAALETIRKSVEIQSPGNLSILAGGSEGWFAQMFNDYRSVKRLTVDEYLSFSRINSSNLDAASLSLLEQVYLASGNSSSFGGSGNSTSSSTGSNSVSSGTNVNSDSSNSGNSTSSSTGGNSSSSSSSSYDFTTPTVPEIKRIDIDAQISEVLKLTNEARLSAGSNELEADESLMELAAIRAQELSELYSHTRPDGTRVVAGGRLANGENIQKGATNAEQAINAWWNSEGHRRTMLNEQYEKFGVGCYQGEDGAIYWVQLFKLG